jgi:hypothetical protein
LAIGCCSSAVLLVLMGNGMCQCQFFLPIVHIFHSSFWIGLEIKFKLDSVISDRKVNLPKRLKRSTDQKKWSDVKKGSEELRSRVYVIASKKQTIENQ